MDGSLDDQHLNRGRQNYGEFQIDSEGNCTLGNCLKVSCNGVDVYAPLRVANNTTIGGNLNLSGFTILLSCTTIGWATPLTSLQSNALTTSSV